MNKLLFAALFITFNSHSQIWKQPLDTLPYMDKFERLSDEKLEIKSYSITDYSPKDSILRYDYYGFNVEGYLIEQFYSMYPNQHVDTNKYHYLKGVIQGEDVKREHIYNDKKRLIEIRETEGDVIKSIHYSYNSNKQLIEIRNSALNWTTFQYNSSGKLIRKDIYVNGTLKEYLNYEHPNDKTLIYQNCINNGDGKSYLPCEVTEGYFDKFNRLNKIVSKYVLDSTTILITEFEYDKKGRPLKMIERSINDPDFGSETNYIRDKKGLLIRIEHAKKGEIYLYSKFDYIYR
jgi:YD repeat-containing protein